MSKLKMLSGLPASGKTTYAREQVKASGNGARVNRDDLRAMLFDSVWTGKREGVVVEIEKAIAATLIKNGYSVIVDDTNLTRKHRDIWHTAAVLMDAQFETETFFEVPLETCIARDRNRDKRVGAAVIYRMALNAGMIDFGDKPIILCDLDGTLCDGSHREHYLEKDKKDWTAYFSEMGMDEPVDFVIRWVRELSKDHTICLVSGRPDTYQHLTIRWLDQHGVPFDYLFMRSGSDKRSDIDIKSDILAKLPKHLIHFCLDDRPCVVKDVWRKHGIKVYPVRGECEDF